MVWRVLILLLLCWSGPLWAFTPAELKDEFLTDPAQLGYAPCVAAGQDQCLVDLIMLVRPEPAYVVNRGVVSRNSFLGTWADVIDGMILLPTTGSTCKVHGKNQNCQQKWNNRLDKLIVPKETINLQDPTTMAFFAEMVTDGLEMANGQPLTQADVTARTTRQGARAEVRWGPGTLVTLRDVSKALHNLD